MKLPTLSSPQDLLLPPVVHIGSRHIPAAPFVAAAVVAELDELRHCCPQLSRADFVAWQLAEAMKKRKISKKMAMLLKTSRTQVDRLLDAKIDITLWSLQRAAAIVGRRVAIELV